jgi:mannose-6-phosphate isomerase-like protein (cupin superfamily)
MTTPSKPAVLHGGAQRLPIRWANLEKPPITISRYRVAPGDQVSLHVHTGKAEYWVIVAGSGTVEVGDRTFAVSEGDVVWTPPRIPHALINTGGSPLEFVNIVQLVDGEPLSTTELAP